MRGTFAYLTSPLRPLRRNAVPSRTRGHRGTSHLAHPSRGVNRREALLRGGRCSRLHHVSLFLRGLFVAGVVHVVRAGTKINPAGDALRCNSRAPAHGPGLNIEEGREKEGGDLNFGTSASSAAPRDSISKRVLIGSLHRNRTAVALSLLLFPSRERAADKFFQVLNLNVSLSFFSLSLFGRVYVFVPSSRGRWTNPRFLIVISMKRKEIPSVSVTIL